MFLRTIWKPFLVCLVATLVLAGCSETRLAVHVAKELGDVSKPKPQGTYKVGKPYQIKGKWYYPKVDPTYDETGLASWYGPNFHGKLTANGEIFDQWAITAAHKTLPMPTDVRVTNLENGRSLVVRVNDRGPFVGDRIIDLSRQSARLLGMEKQGVGRVRVQVLSGSDGQEFVTPKPSENAPQPEILAQPSGTISGGVISGGDVSAGPVEESQPIQPINAPPVAPQIDTAAASAAASSQVTGQVIQQAVVPSEIYIQAGAFTVEENATKLGQTISQFGPSRITPVEVNGKTFYRVRLGPLSDVSVADTLLEQVKQAGVENARLVVVPNN